MTERSKKLSRQFKRYLGAQDAETRAGEIVALLEKEGEALSGDLAPEHIAILKNFSDFADVVDKSYTEYEDRLKIAARNIEMSSKELTDAFRDLEVLNASINAMLDSLGQGLLFFNEKGICSSVYSKICLQLLDQKPADKPLPDVLNFSAYQEKNFYSWLPIAFSEETALDFDDIKTLIPNEIINKNDQIIELDYRPMYRHGDTLSGVLLIATDVTYLRQSDKRLQDIQFNAQKIQQMAQNRNGFHHFITDLYNFIDMASAMQDDTSDDEKKIILRELHTYKGQASTFSLRDLSEKIHDIETTLEHLTGAQFVKALRDNLSDITSLLEKEKEFARNLFGSDFMTQGRVRTVELDKIHDLVAIVNDSCEDADQKNHLVNYIKQHFLAMPVFNAFFSFEREIIRVAEQQGKPIPNYYISGDNPPIVMADYEKFFGVLNHLARNVMDHGIENGEERLAAGKTSEGNVHVTIAHRKEADGDDLEINIRDDGKGLDPDFIRQKLAEERGIDTSQYDDQAVLQYIFETGFSLRKNVDMVSGRGIGMNALRTEIENLGGTLSASSDGKNKGTMITIRVPYIF